MPLFKWNSLPLELNSSSPVECLVWIPFSYVQKVFETVVAYSYIYGLINVVWV